MHKHIKYARVANKEYPLHLQQGGILHEVMVAYETYGKLSISRDNVILLVHALTGDSHPAAHDLVDKEGWWEEMIGPGRPLDTDRFFIICSNILGGCQGTTGPASLNPETGNPYGMSFPEVTIRDMVHVQKRLLDFLNIHHLVLVVGGSMGGMQALQWAVTYPDFMDGIIAIAAPGYSSAQSIAYNKVGRQAIMLDTEWHNGDYYGKGEGPIAGLAMARALGMITYQNERSMEAKFGRKKRNGQFEIENYLNYQGESLVRRFDANSYLYLLNALDLYDLSVDYASYETALSKIKAKVMIVGISSDILYPPYQQEELAKSMSSVGVRVSHLTIDSLYGHDGFLIDFHLLKPKLQGFIDSILASYDLSVISANPVKCSYGFG